MVSIGSFWWLITLGAVLLAALVIGRRYVPSLMRWIYAREIQSLEANIGAALRLGQLDVAGRLRQRLLVARRELERWE
jgi:hypothetical protein